MSETFTGKQISNWEAYEKLRKAGTINMCLVGAGCKLSGLTRDEYIFCMENYLDLKHAAQVAKDKAA